jgi:hypothetical protein
MASLGRLTNSIVSAINENNISLANLNFDFSLVTVQVPPEYTRLGSALTVRRRENAENGAAHRTARRLGALFESVIPNTPRLLAVYGQRASQIVASPAVNPPPNAKQHGPFADYVGAEATSIWAAATSGSSSIAVHLLACLLARAFDDPAVATSVLAELVVERQREVEKMVNSSFSLSAAQFAAVNAASQQFQREELRQLDANARAWLRCADAAMVREHTQLQLIVKNISLPVLGGGASLYSEVISVWKHAMAGLERFLGGEPQSVTNGGILLAISSWHLYPNLVVLGDPVKTVDTKDSLLKDAGVITVGMTRNSAASGQPAVGEETEGIYWSLSLSHYRYYGAPVQVVGGVGERLTIEELHMIALGSLLGSWDVPRSDLSSAARWVTKLWSCVERAKPSLKRPSWLRILAQTADRFITITPESEKQHCNVLVEFGYRRFRTFLGTTRELGKNGRKTCRTLPWLGLRSQHVLSALSCSNLSDGAISYLTGVASSGGLGPGDALIVQVSPGRNKKGRDCMNHVYVSPLRRQDENELRNLPPDSDIPALEYESDENPGSSTTRNRHKHKSRESAREHDAGRAIKRYWQECKFSRWKAAFEIDGRPASPPLFYLDERGWFTQSKPDASTDEEPAPVWSPPVSSWKAAQRPASQTVGSINLGLSGTIKTPLVHDSIVQAFHSETAEVLVPCPAIIQDGLEGVTKQALRYQGFLGTAQKSFRLWLAESLSGGRLKEFERLVRKLRSGTAETQLPLDLATAMLETEVVPLLLWQYLEGADPYEPDDLISDFLGLMEQEREACREGLRPFRNLATATAVYEGLKGATISSRIVETGLAEAGWSDEAPVYSQRKQQLIPTTSYHGSTPLPTRNHVFSCIAMLETGVVNIRPEDLENVFGLSAGNSLFVLSQFLTDPAAQVSSTSVTRLVGNVGRPGVSFLVPPPARPLVRPLSTSYHAVSYEPFDGKWEDNFAGTSLHLSFTKNEFPIDYGVTGIRDHQVFLVESVIAVHNSGEWVADVDLLGAFDSGAFTCLPMRRTPPAASSVCKHSDALVAEVQQNVTSIDTWEEVLDKPPGLSVVRAQNNWPARLAVVAVLWQTRGDRADVVAEDELETSSTLSPSTGSPQSPNHDFAVLGNNNDACHICVYRRLKKALSEGKHGRTADKSFYVVA